MTENSRNQSSLKVNFSLTSNKPKRKKKSVTNINDAFDSGDEEDKARKSAETQLKNRKREGPLVIPLIPPDKSQNNDELKSLRGKNEPISNSNDDDKEAILDLIQSANDHREKRNSRASNDDTNFSSTGSLTIPQPESNPDSRPQQLQISKNSNTDNDEDDADTKKYRKDLSNRAEDVSVSSLAYVHVPISEFGAAMLRGMGWKGNSSKPNKDETALGNNKPRHHRLGLGATPALSEKDVLEMARKKSGRQLKQKSDTERETLLKLKRKNQTQEKKDLQKRIENGSIVWVEQSVSANEKVSSDKNTKKRRAILIQTLGVPGLDQMLIQYENEKGQIAVSKKQILLETQAALKINPFRKYVDESSKQEKEQNEAVNTNDNVTSSHDSNHGPHKQSNDRKRNRMKYDDYNSRSYDRKYEKKYDDSRYDHRRRRSESSSSNSSISQSINEKDNDYIIKRKRSHAHYGYDDDKRERYYNERKKYSSSDKERKRERKRYKSRKRDRENDHGRSRNRRTDNKERRRSNKHRDENYDHKTDRNLEGRRYRDR